MALIEGFEGLAECFDGLAGVCVAFNIFPTFRAPCCSRIRCSSALRRTFSALGVYIEAWSRPAWITVSVLQPRAQCLYYGPWEGFLPCLSLASSTTAMRGSSEAGVLVGGLHIGIWDKVVDCVAVPLRRSLA